MSADNAGEDASTAGPRSKAVWANSPAGSIYLPGTDPDSGTFYEDVLEIRRSHEMPWLSRLVPFGDWHSAKVLEVGCGAGFDALEIARQGAQYTGVDITPENVVRTKRQLDERGIHARVLEADATRLPFAKDSFDVYFSNGVLHHTADFDLALREAHRVLRPSGKVWLVVYHRSSAFYWLTLYLEHWWLRGDRHRLPTFADRLAEIEYTTSEARPVVNAYTVAEVRASLQLAGFQVDKAWIRKLNPEDLPDLPGLRWLWPRLPQHVLDTFARRFGWYVIAGAHKPS